MIPRGTMWRLEPAKPTTSLMIEATNDHFTLPDKGLVGRHAIFDPAMLDTPRIDEAFLAQQDERTLESFGQAAQRALDRDLSLQSARRDRLAWRPERRAHHWRDLRPLMSHRFHLPPSAHTTWATGRFVVCTFVPRPLESDPEGAAPAVLP